MTARMTSIISMPIIMGPSSRYLRIMIVNMLSSYHMWRHAMEISFQASIAATTDAVNISSKRFH